MDRKPRIHIGWEECEQKSADRPDADEYDTDRRTRLGRDAPHQPRDQRERKASTHDEVDCHHIAIGSDREIALRLAQGTIVRRQQLRENI